MGIWYITRESVKRALDSAETARNNWQVDQAIDAASSSVEGLTHRKFYPQTATRYFDWPSLQRGRTWRLWLDGNDLASLTSLTAGGVAISLSDLFLEPANSGPPYTSIEVDLGSTAAFQAGDTHQRAIAATGVWAGCPIDESTAGTLAEALDASETSVDVSNSGAVGVGDILRVDSERMVVTGKQMLTTGQTVQIPLAASSADVTVVVTTGSAYSVDEVILLDSERMLIVDIAGNNLTVKRAWDGSVLAAHTGSTIYAARTLVVTRGALGTSAATHDLGATIARFDPPCLVRQLAMAEALNDLLQGETGYSRSVRAGEAQTEETGGGLGDLRADCYRRHGRKARTAAI